MNKSTLLTLLMIILGTTVLAPVQAQDELVYVAVEPCRLADTRPTEGGTGALSVGSSRNFSVYGADLSGQGGDASGCLHPREASGVEPAAISAYVVAVPTASSGPGHITAYASDGAIPGNALATVNFEAGQVNGNTTNVPLCIPGATACPLDGQMAVIAFSSEQNVVIDVQGYFYPQEVAASSALHVVDGTGNTIGPMVEWNEVVLLLTDTGYFTRVRVVDDFRFTAKAGDVATIEPKYELPGCVGQPYHAQGFEYAIGQGYVVAAYDTTGSRYLVMAKGVTPVTLEAQSISNQDGCLNFSDSLGIKYPIVPNDPNVTGLSVLSFPTPITLQQ